MKIPEAKLTMLPTGAGYSTRSGRATVNVRRTDDGDIEVTAICDSLARQVIILEEELTRIRNETGKEEKPPGVVRMDGKDRRYLSHSNSNQTVILQN